MAKEEALEWSAILISFAAPAGYFAIMVLVFALHLPAGLGTGLFWSPFAILFSIIAIRRPRAAGILLIVSGGLLFFSSLLTDHYTMYYLPVSGIQFAGGSLHLVRSFR